MVKLFSLTYTRPKHVDQVSLNRSTDGSLDQGRSDSSIKSGRSGYSGGIPHSLSFDSIINGGTCPPLTVRDFMNYLIYVEHAAENLQFYLWYQDYVRRFEGAVTKDRDLAPEWTQTMEDEAVARLRKFNIEKLRSEPKAAEIFKGTDFEKQGQEFHAIEAYSNTNPFHTPPQTSNSYQDDTSLYAISNPVSSTLAYSYRSQAADAFQAAGARKPFTIQPFRDEVNRIIATYIMDGAPRQLNLSSWEQKVGVQALSFTTHPSAFRGLFKTIDSSLRRQAHPNFVRWSICNGNPARVFFARALGLGLIGLGLVLGVILTLSDIARGYKAFTAIAFVLGISTLVAAYKGMCVVLHGMHHRHVRPWELFVQDDETENTSKSSFESFGSSNSYEDEPWVVKYDKRNIVRKVFDREVWIQEPALRQIQDTIFVQAMLAALVGGGLLTAVFVAIPGADYL